MTRASRIPCCHPGKSQPDLHISDTSRLSLSLALRKDVSEQLWAYFSLAAAAAPFLGRPILGHLLSGGLRLLNLATSSSLSALLGSHPRGPRPPQHHAAAAVILLNCLTTSPSCLKPFDDHPLLSNNAAPHHDTALGFDLLPTRLSPPCLGADCLKSKSLPS